MPVHFIATSHIAKESVAEIKKAFLDYKPDIIAIELDKRRLHALLTNQKPSYSPAQIPIIGIKGYLFAVIGGLLQRRLGRLVDMQPGADMLQAALLAKNNHLPLFLLDREISITLKRLSKITFKEKMRFLQDLFFGWATKQKVRINLHQVPKKDLIAQLLHQLKNRYPTLHKVLLEERNIFMAKRLAAAMMSNPDKKFLVVLGAGHLEGVQQEFASITKLLKERHTKTA